MSYPDIFKENKLPANYDKDVLVADLLCAWANCELGCKPPETFGHIMADASRVLGCAVTPESLEKMANKILAKRNINQ